MNYCILGRAKVFFFGQDDRLARPRSVQTKVYCNHLCFWLGLEVCFLIVCNTIAQYGLLLIDALCTSSCPGRCGRRSSVAAGQHSRFSYTSGRWWQAIS